MSKERIKLFESRSLPKKKLVESGSVKDTSKSLIGMIGDIQGAEKNLMGGELNSFLADMSDDIERLMGNIDSLSGEDGYELLAEISNEVDEEGGMYVAWDEYLPKLKKLTEATNSLDILDNPNETFENDSMTVNLKTGEITWKAGMFDPKMEKNIKYWLKEKGVLTESKTTSNVNGFLKSNGYTSDVDFTFDKDDNLIINDNKKYDAIKNVLSGNGYVVNPKGGNVVSVKLNESVSNNGDEVVVIYKKIDRTRTEPTVDYTMYSKGSLPDFRTSIPATKMLDYENELYSLIDKIKELHSKFNDKTL